MKDRFEGKAKKLHSKELSKNRKQEKEA